MPPPSTYVAITPVRNEQANLPRTISSFVAQTVTPLLWVIVDDGSRDSTGAIAEEAARTHEWIRVVHREDRGFRKPGTGVIEAFYDGFASINDVRWDFLVKFDGDLAFAPDYFERCFAEFDRDPKLGIGGGLICRKVGGELVAEATTDPAFHVRGATKIYRQACWNALGGLISAPGWDSIDELKANMLDWTTRTFLDLKVHQLKNTGSADGNWRNWVKNGLANYITGYHPLFMMAKCVRRFFRPPVALAAVALGWGYLRGFARRTPRVNDPGLIAYVHRQQLNKLMGRPSLWR